MIVADTSGLLAMFNSQEALYQDVRRAVETTEGPLVVSPFVVAEVDYLVATRHGVAAELAVLRELGSGAYDLASLSQDDIEKSADVIERYRDQEIGVTDASIVVLAARYRTRSVLTLDRRHFGVLRPLDGGRFRVLP